MGMSEHLMVRVLLAIYLYLKELLKVCCSTVLHDEMGNTNTTVFPVV